jgi:hypothetical protein
MTIASYNIPQQLTSVRLAANANISGFYFNGTLNNGIGATLSALNVGQLSIDGVLVNPGDRVLLFSQTNANENGIYIVNNQGGAMSLWSLERSADFQSSEQLIAGQFFTVDAGSGFAGNLFVLIEPLPAAIGTGLIGFTFANVSGDAPPGTYLRVNANLSDLGNRLTAFHNFGFGSGQSIVISDTDFSGGIYTLVNPCPKFINITINNPGSWILRLPPAQDPQSFILSEGPILSVFSNVPGSSVEIQLSDGTNFYTPPEDNYGINLILTDNSTVPGSWDGLFFVENIFCIDEAGSNARQSGEVFLNSDFLAANINFTPVNYTPASGAGFSANSITGNLAGIDAAIVTATSSAFSAYLSSTQTGVTGANTVYQIICDSEDDASADYNASTGIFTAPTSGYYQFSAGTSLFLTDSGMTQGYLLLVTTSHSYVLYELNPFAIVDSTHAYTLSGDITVFMNSGDTAKIEINIIGGAGDNANLSGGNTPVFTYFSGCYVQPGVVTSASLINIVDDNSTNLTMYPVWVSGTAGPNLTFVSSAGFQWNPSTQTLKIGNDNFGDNISISADIIRWGNGVSSPNWDMGELSGPGFGPPNWSIYDYNNSLFLLIADTDGDLGPNATTLYFMYPYNTFPNSTTASQLMATDSNNLMISVPNILGEVTITDDNSTDAAMYPVWVTTNSGNLPTFVSSTGFVWNPSKGNLNITNPGPFGPTIHLNNTSLSDASSWIYHESSGSLKAAFGYRDTISSAVIYLGGDRVIVNNAGVVTIPQLSANMLVATDGSSNLISVTNPGGTQIVNQIWVNNAVGNDTNLGDINSPLKTYAQAITNALALTPTITNQVVIKLIGNFSEALHLYPFIHIDMENSGTFTITGNLATDASFNTTVNGFCNVSNYTLTSSSPIDIIITTAHNQVINFFNGSFGAIPNLSFQGASGSELLYIQDATTNGNFPSGVAVVNGILVLENVVVVGTSDTSPTSTFNSTLAITNSYMGGTIFADSTGSAGGIAVLSVGSSVMTGWQLSGTSSSATIDSTSYNSIPTLSAGALISQVTITGLTDGILQSSYTPLNYTPTAAASYAANTLTGQIAGIDAALGTLITPSLQDVYDNSSTPAVISLSGNSKPIYIQNSQTGGPQTLLGLYSNLNPNITTQYPWGLDFYGLNDAPTLKRYARLESSIVSAAAGFEDASLQVRLLVNGSDTVSLISSGADGSLALPILGGALKIAQGSNACAGTGVTLSGASTTVNTSAVATGDIILFTCTAPGGTQGILSYTISNGVSFTITSSTGVADSSTYSWVIIKAA